MAKNYQVHDIEGDAICFHHRETIEPSQSFRPFHRHNAHEIFLFIDGNADFYIEQTRFRLNPGDLVIVNSKELHRCITNDASPYERYCINVSPSIIQRLSTDKTKLSDCFENVLTGNHIIHLNSAQIDNFISLYKQIEVALVHPGYGQDVMLNSVMAHFLVLLNDAFYRSATRNKNIMPELVKKTMLYIQEHITEDITISDLEKVFYRNGSYISQQFKKNTGLSIRQYIVDQRVLVAKTLLVQGKTVSEACSFAGFTDYSNFIRTFKNVTGMTPGKYKKSVKDNSAQ